MQRKQGIGGNAGELTDYEARTTPAGRDSEASKGTERTRRFCYSGAMEIEAMIAPESASATAASL
jgi:hypothetical protein